ncbi:hypothetical protein WJX73_010088 [Symbiochloris irregularis]|uniref:Amino acid transporter transmembrane domain-containing protein n=1 Tax=Symbiochloris irregularis TaxID=706552 RepID=A0AAW1NZ68_9CHLO
MDLDTAPKMYSADGAEKGELGRSSVSYLGVERPMDQCDEDGHVRRTGTFMTATSHIVTAVIGAGVLSLAWATAQMGWIAGPIAIMMFSFITLYCAFLLCDCYRLCYDWPGNFEGRRLYTYMGAVRAYLGPNYVAFCGIIQHANLVSTSIGYTVTSGQALAAVYRAHCYHYTPDALAMLPAESGTVPCYPTINKYMIIFGAIELVFIQLPDMDRIWWLSIFCAIMSLTYSTIGLGLVIAKSTETDPEGGRGTIDGVKGDTDYYGKQWDIMLALGNIAFAYSFNFILIEISDTVRGPQENKVMKKASLCGIIITTFFYISIGCIGYSAYGNGVAGNLLTGFGIVNPWWLVMLANLSIVLHLIGGYQVWTQPFLALVEDSVNKWFPNVKFLTSAINVPLPGMGNVQISLFRLVWRSVYVCIVTFIALLAPFFNDIVGIMGSLGFWPLTVFLPIEMHIAQRGVPRFSMKWILLQMLSAFCAVISVAAMIGSIAGIIKDTEGYIIFHASY